GPDPGHRCRLNVADRPVGADHVHRRGPASPQRSQEYVMSAVIKDPAPAHQKPLVALCNLNKHYGDFAAVDDISLEIQDGEFLTFLGSSGSGKSTTLSMLAGFETPSSGENLVSGKSLVNVPPHKRDIGMVF
ncbi:Spermidine/putrescine ABC transporter, ATP-binding protein, partial [Pseudomonas syringae pv. maculicola]